MQVRVVIRGHLVRRGPRAKFLTLPFCFVNWGVLAPPTVSAVQHHVLALRERWCHRRPGLQRPRSSPTVAPRCSMLLHRRAKPHCPCVATTCRLHRACRLLSFAPVIVGPHSSSGSGRSSHSSSSSSSSGSGRGKGARRSRRSSAWPARCSRSSLLCTAGPQWRRHLPGGGGRLQATIVGHSLRARSGSARRAVAATFW